MKKIYPCLWFGGNGEEAAKYYVSVFPNSKITQTTHYSAANSDHGEPGSVLTVTMDINGQEIMILNAEPIFKFSEATSLIVPCETQEEIDHLWKKLTSDGGAEVECGWVKDRYGFSWQIVPSILSELMRDPERFDRVMKVVMKSKKLNIAEMKAA